MRYRRRRNQIWVGARIVACPSLAAGERNWDIGGNAGIVSTRSRVVRRFENEDEAKAWFKAHQLNGLIFPLSEVPRPEQRRRIDELSRRREAEYLTSGPALDRMR